jgi:uncharacterized membrane protein
VEELFAYLARVVGLLVEGAAVLIVAFGALEGFVKLLRVAVTPGTTHGERKAIRRRFGIWLILGLEFELAADIIGSVVSPTWQEIGQLGAIALIRTFLNFFLEKDIDSAEASGETPPLPKGGALACVSDDAAEPDVGHSGVDHLRLPRGGPIAVAVVRRAQMRAAFHHLAWNAKLRLVHVVAFLR